MRRRNFRHLVVASGLSNLADGVFQITLPLVALGITRDPKAFASVTLVGGSRGCCSHSRPVRSPIDWTGAAQ